MRVRILLGLLLCTLGATLASDDPFAFEEIVLQKASAVGNGMKLAAKKVKFKESVAEAKATLKQTGEDKDLQGALKGLGGGLTKLVNGIVSGSWSSMIIGGLDIVGTLATLAGPMGTGIATILSVVSMTFGLFGGAPAVQESQEDAMRRVIDEALTKAKADDLRADGESLKKVVASIRNSVNQFREEDSLTEDQANELYNKAFMGLRFFGRLKFYINKYCDCSVPNPADEEKVNKARVDAARCLEFLNLYADTSILRQLLIADIASLAGSVGLNGTSSNLLFLTEKEKVTDKDTMMFLMDPIGSRKQRFCIAQYFGHPNNYPTLKAYLKVLTKQEGGKRAYKHAMVCSQPELLGACFRLEPKNYNQRQLQDWGDSGNIKSLFVSVGLSITGFSKDEFKGAAFGPIPGPTVIGVVPGSWKSVKIRTITPGKTLRVCQERGLKQNGRCDELPVGRYPDLNVAIGQEGEIMTRNGDGACKFPYQDSKGVLHEKCAFDEEESDWWCAYTTKDVGEGWENYYDDWGWCDFPQSWTEKVNSMSIPTDTVVYLYTKEQYNGTRFGPFYGPATLEKVCGGNRIHSMKVLPTDKRVDDMVKICRGEEFTDVCDFLEVGEYGAMAAHGCFFNNEDIKVKSIKVPGGLAVYMWTKETFGGLPIGPYIGPVSVPLIDTGEPALEENNRSQIKSMKIFEYSHDSEIAIGVEKKKKKKIKRRFH